MLRFTKPSYLLLVAICFVLLTAQQATSKPNQTDNQNSTGSHPPPNHTPTNHPPANHPPDSPPPPKTSPNAPLPTPNEQNKQVTSDGKTGEGDASNECAQNPPETNNDLNNQGALETIEFSKDIENVAINGKIKEFIDCTNMKKSWIISLLGSKSNQAKMSSGLSKCFTSYNANNLEMYTCIKNTYSQTTGAKAIPSLFKYCYTEYIDVGLPTSLGPIDWNFNQLPVKTPEPTKADKSSAQSGKKESKSHPPSSSQSTQMAVLDVFLHDILGRVYSRKDFETIQPNSRNRELLFAYAFSTAKLYANHNELADCVAHSVLSIMFDERDFDLQVYRAHSILSSITVKHRRDMTAAQMINYLTAAHITEINDMGTFNSKNIFEITPIFVRMIAYKLMMKMSKDKKISMNVALSAAIFMVKHYKEGEKPQIEASIEEKPEVKPAKNGKKQKKEKKKSKNVKAATKGAKLQSFNEKLERAAQFADIIVDIMTKETIDSNAENRFVFKVTKSLHQTTSLSSGALLVILEYIDSGYYGVDKRKLPVDANVKIETLLKSLHEFHLKDFMAVHLTMKVYLPHLHPILLAYSNLKDAAKACEQTNGDDKDANKDGKHGDKKDEKHGGKKDGKHGGKKDGEHDDKKDSLVTFNNLHKNMTIFANRLSKRVNRMEQFNDCVQSFISVNRDYATLNRQMSKMHTYCPMHVFPFRCYMDQLLPLLPDSFKWRTENLQNVAHCYNLHLSRWYENSANYPFNVAIGDENDIDYKHFLRFQESESSAWIENPILMQYIANMLNTKNGVNLNECESASEVHIKTEPISLQELLTNGKSINTPDYKFSHKASHFVEKSKKVEIVHKREKRLLHTLGDKYFLVEVEARCLYILQKCKEKNSQVTLECVQEQFDLIQPDNETGKMHFEFNVHESDKIKKDHLNGRNTASEWYAFSMFLRVVPGHSQLLGHFFVYLLQNHEKVPELNAIFKKPKVTLYEKINESVVTVLNAIDGVNKIDLTELIGWKPTCNQNKDEVPPHPQMKENEHKQKEENLSVSTEVLDLIVGFSRYLHLNRNNHIDQSMEGLKALLQIQNAKPNSNDLRGVNGLLTEFVQFAHYHAHWHFAPKPYPALNDKFPSLVEFTKTYLANMQIQFNEKREQRIQTLAADRNHDNASTVEKGAEKQHEHPEDKQSEGSTEKPTETADKNEPKHSAHSASENKAAVNSQSPTTRPESEAAPTTPTTPTTPAAPAADASNGHEDPHKEGNAPPKK